ncbi:hypothetical protein K469DRAFT_750951 [Zopfia rhizophila CBS 207.26]|uniref:Extracellular membrane protein CFEM domain-containing protein n=1 Tax=Zopfia rhizophila CBS 207.26 TaxID=1314779 RepID=A0A6A6E2I6_9PEZI|nr:hypothetical protein K469DRAFT_750951 [Zopfia rhizophila CBS 207.26]
MFGKATLFLAFVAVAKLAVAASHPPACMLGAVNTHDDPAKVSEVCKSKDITQTISKFCGDDTKNALSAFADICNKTGVKVSTDVPTSTGSLKPSGTSNSTIHGTAASTLVVATSGIINPTGGSPAASGTATGGPTQSTGAAGKLEVGIAAVMLGVVAAAL